VRIDLLAQLNTERAARRACVLVTRLASGEQRLVLAAEVAADPLAEVLVAQIRQGRSATLGEGDDAQFLNVQVPPPRVVVTGAVHISQAMVPMARTLGLDLTIIDPRTAFASPERFPDVALHADWPDVAIPALGGLDAFTAMVALTHDPKIDDPALIAALRSESFYIGALGSRKTHARRIERLEAAGFGADDIARIHAPVGLDIGAVSPAEIALSIMAEIIAALRRERRRSAT
jgi:xanthine dehydrogenase accessory factor